MRLTVMGQIAKGLALESGPASNPDDDQKDGRLDVTELDKQLESLKWHLWHGNAYRAVQIIEDLEWDLESQEERFQVRTQVLNDDLRATFERWYPGLKADPAPAEEAAA